VHKGDSEMMVLITYDVNTETPAGRKRLRQVAKQCVNYGQRVQNSVFECVLDSAKCREAQHKLEHIIDKNIDSLRFYYLGNNYKEKVEHVGANLRSMLKGF
jgi:CRISPR-associated protein Cas2